VLAAAVDAAFESRVNVGRRLVASITSLMSRCAVHDVAFR